MGCCDEKQMIERLKVLSHALVLACQEANIRNTTIAVVTLTHHHYGEYYKGIDINEAGGMKIHRKFNPGDTMKKNVKTKKAQVRGKRKPGDSVAV